MAFSRSPPGVCTQTWPSSAAFPVPSTLSVADKNQCVQAIHTGKAPDRLALVAKRAGVSELHLER